MSKVTIIGAGSILWAPKILGDFYMVPEQAIDEICLSDLSKERLALIVALTRLMEQKTGRKFKITAETNLERAVEGADFIVAAISIGGLKAMEKDLTIPEKYGVFATVGDTVGPGGFSRMLRSVPVFTDMVKRIERVVPDAWFLNVSNPLTGITKLINEKTSLKAVGVCSGIINHLWILKDLLGFEDISEVEFKVGGIDHCSWFLELKVSGQDIYPQLRNMSVEGLDKKASLFHSKDEWKNLDSLTAGFTLFKMLGYLPAISDRHLGEFFPFFLSSEDNLRRYNMKRTCITDRTKWGENAQNHLEAILAGKKELKIEKTRDIVVDIINALAGTGSIVTTVNYPNEGQIENLPRDAVVETLGRIDKNTITPLMSGPLPEQILPIILPHLLREELVLKAAQEGSRELFVAALVSDPTTQSLDTIQWMVDELLQAHKELLPQFDI